MITDVQFVCRGALRVGQRPRWKGRRVIVSKACVSADVLSKFQCSDTAWRCEVSHSVTVCDMR